MMLCPDQDGTPHAKETNSKVEDYPRSKSMLKKERYVEPAQDSSYGAQQDHLPSRW
jgi:hypothetical protein